jgi:hypothetical protein
LAKAIGDLFWNFPYHRLPQNHTLVALLMRPEIVLALVVFYWCSKRPLKALVAIMAAQQKQEVDPNNKITNQTPTASSLSSGTLRIAVGRTQFAVGSLFCHYCPVFLAYCHSGACRNMESTIPIVTLTAKRCRHTGFGAWALVFYISKYYEFVDTWILVLKVRIWVCYSIQSIMPHRTPLTHVL